MTQTRDFMGIVSRLLAIMTIALGGLYFAQCSLFESGNPFGPEYETSNFIETLGFDVFTGTGPAPAIPDQASWDLKYRYSADWDLHNYVTLVPVTDAGYDTAGGAGYAEPLPAGLDAASPVYRLELVNLIQDGSFETGLGGGFSSTPPVTYGITSSSPLNGLQSLALSSAGGTITWIPTVVAYPATAGHPYQIEFRYPLSGSTIEMQVKISSDPVAYTPDNSTGHFGAAFLPASSGEALTLTFEPVTPVSGFTPVNIDDVTMCSRSYATVRLLLGRNDTVPVLESGVYSFSVWARVDYDASGTEPPYHLDRFTVSMSDTEYSTLAAASSTYVYSAATPGWRRITARLSGNVLQYTVPELTPDVPVLSLDIDLQSSRPGSVLLATPELRFHPNGL